MEGNNGLSGIIAEYLHEHYPFVRIGIGSGEYPHGLKHVLSLGADFYFSTNEIRYDKEWIVDQLRKGYVTQAEFESRGTQIESPYGFKGIESK